MNFKHAIAAVVTAAIMMPGIGAAEAKTSKEIQSKKQQLNQFNRHFDRDDGYVAPRHYQGDRHSSVWMPGIDRRIERQMRRIRRGVRRGQLTRWETMRLRSRIFTIRSVRQFARLDGHVSGRERREIVRMLNQNSQLIRQLKRNDHERSFRSAWF
ncbi:MAG: hypothetical protein JXQ99_21210 [Hyphomicrobiaceae bacterium]